MFKYLKIISCAIIISIVFFGVSNVFAQLSDAPSEIEFELTPENPAPNQEISVYIRSYSADLSVSEISWLYDGRLIAKEIGHVSDKITAPALGKKKSLSVSAVTPQGRRLTGRIEIGSGSVDLIVETDGFVHPFYQGKLSPVYHNTVKIIAIPHLADTNGTEYNPKTLTYKWSMNGKVLEADSGYGKNMIKLKGELVPRPFVVEVTISTRDKTSSISSKVPVAPQEPQIGFYVDDPLYGTLFNRAAGQTLYLGASKEVGILAVPYGINKDPENLILNWTVNGSPKINLNKGFSIVLRAPEKTEGLSNIGLRIRNEKDILQSVSSSFTAWFKNGAQQETAPKVESTYF